MTKRIMRRIVGFLSTISVKGIELLKFLTQKIMLWTSKVGVNIVHSLVCCIPEQTIYRPIFTSKHLKMFAILKKNKQRIIVIPNIFHYTFVYKVLLRSKNITFHLRNYYYINLILSTLLRILILIHSFSLRVISMLTIPNICKQVRFCLHYKNNPLKRVMYFLSNECHLHSPHKTSKKAFYCSYLHLSLNHLKYYLWWKVS